jgi:hypothetical protein
VEHAVEPSRGADLLLSAAPPARDLRRSPFARHLGWFGVGAALALLVMLMRDMQADPAPPGPVAVWTADRDAHRVFGLDADLILARRIVADWPLEVEATHDGGLWVLRSDDGQAGSTSRLDRLGPDGSLITELFLENTIALSVLDEDQALVLERVNNSVRLSRVRTEGSLFPLLDRPDLACVSGSRAGILAGTSTGTVLRIDPGTGTLLAQIQLDGTIGDIVPGPRSGSSWALDTQGTGRLFLLDEALAIRWAAGVGFAGRHLGAVPGEERVWIADTGSQRVRRFGANGVVEIDRQNLPGIAFDRTLAWSGGALVLTPGAILRLDHDGMVVTGQGGFAWLSDAARAR